MTETESQIIRAVAAQSAIIRAEIKKALLKHWLTEGEAAIYLSCSPNLISQMRIEGRLKAGTLGKRWRYHIDDLDKVVVTGKAVSR